MLQVLIDGLATGSTFSLVAIALVVVWRGSGMLNFAQAEQGLFGAFVVWQLASVEHVNYYLAILIGIVVVIAMAVAIERIIVRPLGNQAHLALLIIAIGLYEGINGLSSRIWGEGPRSIPVPFPSTVHVGGVALSVNALIAIAVAVVVTIVLSIFFRSRAGIQLRAVADDRGTAQLLGVRAGRVVLLGWAIAAVIALFALVLLAQQQVLQATIGVELIIEATVAATVGGFTSVTGAFLAGLGLGVAEGFYGRYVSGGTSIVVAFLVVVVVLMIRKEGLFSGASLREA